uniref:Uncharacterized protein n=1 Tax=Zea mays TaxID=4577 RepID=C4J5V5_MAIZE|nr:unknown [Zea mays]
MRRRTGGAGTGGRTPGGGPGATAPTTTRPQGQENPFLARHHLRFLHRCRQNHSIRGSRQEDCGMPRGVAGKAWRRRGGI